MIAIIQRVSSANVVVSKKTIGAINLGILALIGIQPNDDEAKSQRMCHKLLNYRIFSDDDDKMNLNVQQVNGGLLLVPQFTIAADTSTGMRASFTRAASPDKGQRLFNHLIQQAKNTYSTIETGEFGADMQVNLSNEGPVTFILEVQ